MDVEDVAGSCISPLSFTERFISKIIMTPGLIAVGIIMSIPLWNKLRSLGCLRKLWEKLQMPHTVERIHVKRAFANGFIFICECRQVLSFTWCILVSIYLAAHFDSLRHALIS